MLERITAMMIAIFAGIALSASADVLFSGGFETSEGYVAANLTGQNGWNNPVCNDDIYANNFLWPAYTGIAIVRKVYNDCATGLAKVYAKAATAGGTTSMDVSNVLAFGGSETVSFDDQGVANAQRIFMKSYQGQNTGIDDFTVSAHLPGMESNLVSELFATCRHGQVFIQWDESPENNANLSVYMYTVPITAANLGRAQRLEQRIEPHSANDWYEDPSECPKTSGPARGWILEDGGASLNSDDGLFVHTVVESDPVQAYFAVLTDDQDASDLVAGMNTLTQSVSLAAAPIQPIWQLGTDTVDWAAAKDKPLAIYLHGHQDRPSGLLTYLIFGDKTLGWREGLPFKFKVTVRDDVVLVEPYDRVWINRKLDSSETSDSYNTLYKNIETWHYGTCDLIYDPALRHSGTVENYTERLYLKILDWVQQTYQTDTNKVYAYGGSMGTGVQRLVMQNPTRFASADLLVPFLDWSYVNGSESNAKRLDASCGSMSMPTSDGVTLGERMNLVDFIQNTTRDLPHITIRAGRQDSSVWWARKPLYVAAMQANRHGLLAGWDNGTHSTAMRQSVPGFPDYRDYSYAISHFSINKSYPAFSNFSMNEDPGSGDKTDGDIVGFINRGLDWSGIVDKNDRYEVKVLVARSDAVYPVTVDVTLRNLQNFSPQPGQVLRAQNRDGAGAVMEEKNITVDSNGLLTYEAFSVTSAQGNILTVVK